MTTITMVTADHHLQDPSKVPSWLLINKSLLPDFVVADPKVGHMILQCVCHYSTSTDCSSMGDHRGRVLTIVNTHCRWNINKVSSCY